MTTPGVTASLDEARAADYQALADHNAGALWTRLHGELRSEPVPVVEPYLWRWADLRPLVLQSGDLVTAEEAVRRVVMLLNPGLPGKVATTQTLYAGIMFAESRFRRRLAAPG